MEVKTLTPIEYLINNIDKKIESIEKEYEDGKFKSSLLSKWLLFKATIDFLDLKEKEKEAIIEAVTYGNRQEVYDGTEMIGEHYYNTKYNNNGK